MQVFQRHSLEKTRAKTTPPITRTGVVYTKPWIVDLILDLAGYSPEADLAELFAVEPSVGNGAFLVPMALRLLESCRRRSKVALDGKNALLAFDVDEDSVQTTREIVAEALTAEGIQRRDARALAARWIKVGDYLEEAPALKKADFVIGNPPYIRLEAIPEDRASFYRSKYPTMKGRADIYIAFFEAALKNLSPGGICAFISPDRWMRNQYGGQLRSLVTSDYGVRAVIEMHDADAFLSDVNAYPAITIIHKAQQNSVLVAKLEREAEASGTTAISRSLRSIQEGQHSDISPGIRAEHITTWFQGTEPWSCISPERLALLKRLESQFHPLESAETGTKVGIGVATGADKVFITKNAALVEPSRLLPLAMPYDLLGGALCWSGHYLVNPWEEKGIADLVNYPRLRAYMEANRALLEKRHIVKKNAQAWLRTIDRVNTALTIKPKLYIADIKDRLNPVLDQGTTYPHHNLYFIQSDKWDLEVLGGLLFSEIGHFFVECYGVRMRGGYLRFQAQYLRRIRVPHPKDITANQKKRLIAAFRQRDREAATKVALEVYGIESLPAEVHGGY
jgi:adenine-specific DNA-methyltransferase